MRRLIGWKCDSCHGFVEEMPWNCFLCEKEICNLCFDSFGCCVKCSSSHTTEELTKVFSEHEL